MEALAPGGRRQEAQQGAGKAARSPKSGSPSAGLGPRQGAGAWAKYLLVDLDGLPSSPHKFLYHHISVCTAVRHRAARGGS
jgi:hypothetical protein